ncbi:hypothetical protein Aduo_012117 [Ancylostoma duodenale]
MKEMFFPNAVAADLKVARANAEALGRALEEVSRYTYASCVVLGIEDFSRMTAAEKDELMFVLFPLVAAKNMCADPAGSVCVLGYWFLGRVLAESIVEEALFNGIRNIASTLKPLCYQVSTKLFTLKFHV